MSVQNTHTNGEILIQKKSRNHFCFAIVKYLETFGRFEKQNGSARLPMNQ
jgi:hypothetical protein